MDASQSSAEMFRCDRQSMSLTRGGCARLWNSAQADTPDQGEGRWHCRACPIGAAHAGVSDPQGAADAEAAAIELEDLCPRCYRTGNRLIGDHLCVSCYNRAREIVRGRNCKGNPPKVVQARLRPVAVLVADAGAAHATRPTEFRAVTGAAEAMLTAAKAAGGKPLVFSRPTGLPHLVHDAAVKVAA